MLLTKKSGPMQGEVQYSTATCSLYLKKRSDVQCPPYSDFVTAIPAA
ncbi:hypothetical protein SAMN05443144_102121 [Fodinibius roseus]|uniref:Uncharacterized protein n=1 Tax=Fodinibius roseus TaxID=1194090 RepID=A0A1M4UTG5_9BACT|nr:hypothetical protein SAMN05443144_102121 [Fodinibius roseus]